MKYERKLINLLPKPETYSQDVGIRVPVVSGNLLEDKKIEALLQVPPKVSTSAS
ncbi:MAG: hypothetical protein F6K58_10650 [Symploca sp. SIO2E9]|nr:hypothetical protein [Symploca sp. SIO2E9]